MSGPAVVDYSYARPAPAAIKDASYLGAVRYLAPLPNAKVVTAAELQQLWAAGLDVGLVWESYAQAASGGYTVGHGEGTEALRQADALGWPTIRPVYFVMEDPNPIPTSQWPAVEDYCHGLADAGWPAARIGGYGSQALVEHLLHLGLIAWGWQVGGWSPSVSPMCHLYQRLSPTIAPPALAGSIDEDAVLKADWGGWHPGQTVTTQSPAQEAPNMPQLSGPVVGGVVRPQQDGYWIVGQDGGVFNFGNAPAFTDPVVGKLAPGRYIRNAVATSSGAGMWLFASDGGVITLGDAKYYGSVPGLHVAPSAQPIQA